MNNPTFNINKPFKEQVNNCMKNIFGTIKQPRISKILAKIEYKNVSIINVL